MKSFLDGRGVGLAAGLAYSSLLSFIPLVVAVTILTSTFFGERGTGFFRLLRFFVPGTSREVLRGVEALVDEAQVASWVATARLVLTSLRVYFDVGEPASRKIEAMTDAALREACEKSRSICEVCGVRGVYEERGERIGVLCEPCNWINDIEIACRRLTEIGKKWTSATRAQREILLDAGRRHVQHLGEAASHQSPRRRAKLPGIDWKRLDGFRPIYVNNRLNQFGPKELRKYIRDEVPLIKETLR